MISSRISNSSPNSRLGSSLVNTRIQTSNVSLSTAASGTGSPIGLLLALTYAGTNTTTSGGSGPHSRITNT